MPNHHSRASETARGHPRPFIPGTNAIESITARCRRAVLPRGHLPTEQAAHKCLYLVTRSLDPPAGAGHFSHQVEARIKSLRDRLRMPARPEYDQLAMPVTPLIGHSLWLRSLRPERAERLFGATAILLARPGGRVVAGRLRAAVAIRSPSGSESVAVVLLGFTIGDASSGRELGAGGDACYEWPVSQATSSRGLRKVVHGKGDTAWWLARRGVEPGGYGPGCGAHPLVSATLECGAVATGWFLLTVATLPAIIGGRAVDSEGEEGAGAASAVG
jgi:hypothetical protein